MQLFIDNWIAPILADAANNATEISVAPDLAARLTGLGDGNFYQVTAAVVDTTTGTETAWEVMKVTGVTDGVLTVERGPGALPLEAGMRISARLTASALNLLRDSISQNATTIETLSAALADLEARVSALEPHDGTISLTPFGSNWTASTENPPTATRAGSTVSFAGEFIGIGVYVDAATIITMLPPTFTPAEPQSVNCSLVATDSEASSGYSVFVMTDGAMDTGGLPDTYNNCRVTLFGSYDL